MVDKKIKIPQYEVVIELGGLGEYDNVYLIQLEIHNALKEAGMRNMPHRKTANGKMGLIQLFMPQSVYDEEFIADIVKSIVGDLYKGITIGIKE